MSYETQLQRSFLYHPLVEVHVERTVSRFQSLYLLSGIRDFRLTLYKLSVDWYLCDEQQTRIYQQQRLSCFLPGLDCVLLFIDQHHV
ncbi:hypothetical protein TNCV_4308901 [Trichonephila clavipes]|nr:hypothetical protein TNCV_4308901 [Trichonephila clavipes]